MNMDPSTLQRIKMGHTLKILCRANVNGSAKNIGIYSNEYDEGNKPETHTLIQCLKNSKEYQLIIYCAIKLRSGFPNLGLGSWLKRAGVGFTEEPEGSFEADRYTQILPGGKFSQLYSSKVYELYNLKYVSFCYVSLTSQIRVLKTHLSVQP